MNLNKPNSNNILISIISASFNCVNTIEDSIKSILPHLSENIEFIIIDGKSNDGTVEIIRKYESFISYWVSENDRGIYDAWNKGIVKAKGKYLCFVGLDDSLCENYSTEYLNVINQYNDLDFISSKMIIKKNKSIEFGEKWEWNSFRKQMNIVHPGSLHNAKLFQKYGVYDTKYSIAGDYEFLLRIGKNLNAHFINKPTINFSLNGISNNNFFKLANEVRTAKIKNKSRNILLINIEFSIRILIGFISPFYNYFKKSI